MLEYFRPRRRRSTSIAFIALISALAAFAMVAISTEALLARQLGPAGRVVRQWVNVGSMLPGCAGLAFAIIAWRRHPKGIAESFAVVVTGVYWFAFAAALSNYGW